MFRYYEYLLEKKNSEQNKRKERYDEWKELINMSLSELNEFYNSEDGKEAGLSKKEADSEGIDSGRESATWIMMMLQKGRSFDSAEKNWTSEMWKWARKQISFIKRMSGMKPKKNHPYREKNGEMTEWLRAMMIWGHDPRKDDPEKNYKDKK